jgi:dUTP pyrophosphatase
MQIDLIPPQWTDVCSDYSRQRKISKSKYPEILMTSIPIKIQCLVSQAKIPQYAHPGDAGADLFAAEDCEILPGEWLAVSTGLAAEVAIGYELQVRPRSGLAIKKGITVLNAPGTIDAGYRGEIKVILINHGDSTFPVKTGDKIAQMVLATVSIGEFTVVNELTDSARGAGGFGSTGV